MTDRSPDRPVPDNAVTLYITLDQIDAMIEAGTWPKPEAGNGRSGLDVRSGLAWITPGHPEFAKMVEAWGGVEEKREWEACRAALDKEIWNLRTQAEIRGEIKPRPADFGLRKPQPKIEAKPVSNKKEEGGIRDLDPGVQIVQLRPDPELWNLFSQKCAAEKITKRQGYTTALTDMVILKQRKYKNAYNKKIIKSWPCKNIYLSIDLIISAGKYGWHIKERNKIFNTALLNYCSK